MDYLRLICSLEINPVALFEYARVQHDALDASPAIPMSQEADCSVALLSTVAADAQGANQLGKKSPVAEKFVAT